MSESAHNKKIVLQFVDQTFGRRRPEEAAISYVGPRSVQHNPHVPDGPAGTAALAAFIAEHPELSLDVRRVIAEDDLVVTHSLMKLSSDDRGSAVVDIFRLENGRIVEHWDVIQPVPEQAANDNTMF